MADLSAKLRDQAERLASDAIVGLPFDDEHREFYIQAFAAGYIRCWNTVMDKVLDSAEARKFMQRILEERGA